MQGGRAGAGDARYARTLQRRAQYECHGGRTRHAQRQLRCRGREARLGQCSRGGPRAVSRVCLLTRARLRPRRRELAQVRAPCGCVDQSSPSLSYSLLAAVLAGDVVVWNDERILALNPAVGTSLPASNITRVLLQPPSYLTHTITKALAELVPQAWPFGAVTQWPFNASASVAYVQVRCVRRPVFHSR